MKIYRNLLPKNKFLKIKNVLMSSDFSWYYNNMVNTEKDNMFQFTHNFYTDPKINSAYFNLLEPVFKK